MRTNITRGAITWAISKLLGGACIALGFVPEAWIGSVLQNPPVWVGSPWLRLGTVALGTVVFFFGNSIVERLGGDPIDRRRRVMVAEALTTLNCEAKAWLANHYAGGRPPDHLGQSLNAVHLVDRDFVGWTEVKPELKPIIAEQLSPPNSFPRQCGRRLMAVTSMQWIIVCLAASIAFGAIALVLIIREQKGGRDIQTNDAAAATAAVARLPSNATAPIERLAELGWTVAPQPDKLQFSISRTTLPDMSESAELFAKLDRPFTLQLQNLTSLTGLHLLAASTQCTEIGIGAGEFTDTTELAAFTNLTKLTISQTPLNGKGILDASSLGKLVNLRFLVLNSSRVKDITFVSTLINLETLSLGSTLITDIASVSALSKLTAFDVRGTRATDLRPLRQSLALQELEVGGAQVPSLANLAHIEALKTLRVIEQGDVDLSPLGALVSLERLFVWGPLSIDASVFRPLKALKNLQMSGFGFQQIATKVSNASAFSELKALSMLTLGSMQLNNLDFVNGLTSLTALNLNELPISSIEPVRTLRQLKSISLTTVPVSDISPLVDLPSLEEVRLMRVPARTDAVSALEKRGVKVTVY
ncbi:leucine-rich repeat domain-containing protein [Bradyrhizobium yuanmingense]|uniref:leucine-rich repeat domain-containing protein n=1 Tax=Bradyrhizobium yuanmingense TaxID=108015 RepID=UPI001CD1E2C2|nr:hypothetical protein [Bradyrhizobium yuanmingense]MCA1525922.1 hypothetical protein [Bradyrhizobium yuanmingense]